MDFTLGDINNVNTLFVGSSHGKDEKSSCRGGVTCFLVMLPAFHLK